MRSFLAVTVMLLAAPNTARADGIFTPFVGASFGESDVEKVTTVGASLAAMAGGVFGFEIDFARTTEASTDAAFIDNGRATTVMGNLIIGIPIKGVRPYAVGGLGWLQTEASADTITEKRDGLGFDVGGGLMGVFSEHVGARFDLRYTRSISLGEGLGEIIFEELAFWRASVGVALLF